MVPETLGSAVTAARGKTRDGKPEDQAARTRDAQEMQGMRNYTHIKQAVKLPWSSLTP